jgi:hypothetical protein
VVVSGWLSLVQLIVAVGLNNNYDKLVSRKSINYFNLVSGPLISPKWHI